MNVRVLVVDDDQVDREMIRRALLRDNSQIEITEACTVNEGLAIYDSNEFDVVLLDYHMPQRDGIEMILELRNRVRDFGSAIIMMSSSEDEKLAIDCLKAGAQDFISKVEVNSDRLQRALIHAQAKFKLEHELRESYSKVKQLAESDSLTGLANRFLFDETLKVAVANNCRRKHQLALLILDVDHFKYINDTHGHDVGDRLLQKFVTRITGCLRGNELFARLGGDEFGIMVANLEKVEYASQIAQRIHHVLAKPFNIDNLSIKATSSIGIAICNGSSGSNRDLFKNADIALYRAKRLGRNQISFFEESMQSEFLHRYKLDLKLAQALAEYEFTLNFQPVINAITNEVMGAEVLLRWFHDEQYIPPDEFVPIAEQSRKINEIGRWVIDSALKQLATWRRYSNNTEMILAINLSAVQLDDPDFPQFINQRLSCKNIPPENIEFELTETALLKPTEDSMNTLAKIHRLGCRIALDDFGTGYSSISHLHNFPIDTVKIDRSLMPVSENDTKRIALLKGLCAMIDSLGLDTVAEGVETSAHASLCRELSVKRLQGYFYAKPMTANDFKKGFLEKSPVKFLKNQCDPNNNSAENH